MRSKHVGMEASIVAAVLILASFADSGVAHATLYCVDVQAGGSQTPCVPGSALPSSLTDVAVTGGIASASGGVSSPGSLGVKVVVGSGGIGTAKAALADFQIVISGPTGATTSTSINLSLTGFAEAPVDGTDVVLRVTTSLAGSLGTVNGSGSAGAQWQFSPDPGGSGGFSLPVVFSSGMLSPIGNSFGGPTGFGGTTFVTPSLTVVSGEMIRFDLSLVGAAISCVSAGCSASIDYLNTLRFVQGASVLNLPAGWTANSLDGSIVNNVYLGPNPPTVPALGPIGLPGVALVLLLGGTWEIGRRRPRLRQ